MCEMCDPNSSRNCIYTDPLTNEWYLDIETSQWDEYDDDWVHDKEYINYCPYCGRDLYEIDKSIFEKGIFDKSVDPGDVVVRVELNDGKYVDMTIRQLKEIAEYIETHKEEFDGIIS